jgi:hypothetical protein
VQNIYTYVGIVLFRVSINFNANFIAS